MKGKISDKEYQELISMAKLIETRDLAELVEKFSIYKNIGKGAGSYYDSHLLFINALFPGVFCHN